MTLLLLDPPPPRHPIERVGLASLILCVAAASILALVKVWSVTA